MPTDVLDRPRRSLTPLIVVTAAAAVFALLLVLVRVQWAPLESADHGAAARINGLIAGHATLVAVVKAVTWLGSGGVLWTVIGVAAVVLAIRRRWRLAIYLLVAGAGALVLDPVLKSLVGRLRPVVAHPVAYGIGNSFPSGHSLGSIVCYGAMLLVFLPATHGRWRRAFIAGIVTLVALIGISRILLGVHYISDVLGGWALGITWLGLTAFAFELTRRATGQPVTDPVTEGLEPEARADLRPAQPGARRGVRRPGGSPWSHRRRSSGGLGADSRRHRRHRRTDHQGRQRQRTGRPDDPALVRRPPHAQPEPLEPGHQHARGDPGDPHRRRGHLRGISRQSPGTGGRSCSSPR